MGVLGLPLLPHHLHFYIQQLPLSQSPLQFRPLPTPLPRQHLQLSSHLRLIEQLPRKRHPLCSHRINAPTSHNRIHDINHLTRFAGFEGGAFLVVGGEVVDYADYVAEVVEEGEEGVERGGGGGRGGGEDMDDGEGRGDGEGG